MESFKTTILLTGMTLFFITIGGMLAGQMGMIIAFIVAIGMNFWAYYNSDKAVLSHYNAIEVNHDNATELLDMVERLTQKAELPMPKVYIIPDPIPNAFATGRNAQNAAVAVTEGLLDTLDTNEVEAVIAHELSHIKHSDILISTIAATIAGAISMIVNFGMMFGGGQNRPNIVVQIALMVLAPLAASIIQMSISRSREYKADEGAARLTGHPEWLASALMQLEKYNSGRLVKEASKETSHMFIINPFTGKDISFAGLFRTHPTTQDRIDRLGQL